MAVDPIIRLRGVGKAYDLVTAAGNMFTRYVLSRAHHALRGEEFWAVRGVDLDIRAGEMVGIIGPNGSGKSTLLRLIAGISEPSEGTVEVHGRIVPMLEVGVGFHEELTGYENVFLHASVFGLTRRQIEDRLRSIVGFSEIGEFMEMPIKHFSTGMRTRLGFAVAIHCDPDVLVVDEVLAVGDGPFQLKCVAALMGLHRRGATVLFVTHNIRHARTLCERILWLDHGRPVAWGPSEEVALAYRRAVCDEALGFTSTADPAVEPAATVDDVRLTAPGGGVRDLFRHGDPLEITLRGTAHASIDAPDLRITVVRDDYELAGAAMARGSGPLPDRIAPGPFTWTAHWPEIFLNTGTYEISLTLLSHSEPVLRLPQAARLRVEAPQMVDAETLADLPCTFSLRT
ncbi:MAG: ABC transporter ATP-binding protein [Candidatus Sumerlaeia bacterium]|nr:ABC transporter ATP-binding protein [Candidatus Sumerlaeia bacterium]